MFNFFRESDTFSRTSLSRGLVAIFISNILVVIIIIIIIFWTEKSKNIFFPEKIRFFSNFFIEIVLKTEYKS